MITLTLPKFILQCRTLNQHNELRTFGFAVSVSSEWGIQNEAYKKQMPNWSTIYLPLVIFQNI
jgi:hypothetical protein